MMKKKTMAVLTVVLFFGQTIGDSQTETLHFDDEKSKTDSLGPADKQILTTTTRESYYRREEELVNVPDSSDVDLYFASEQFLSMIPSPTPMLKPTKRPKTISPTTPSPTVASPQPTPIGSLSSSLMDVLEIEPTYSTFTTAVETTGLTSSVSTKQLTIFVPDNNASDDSYFQSVLSMENYRLHLSNIMQNHLTEQGVYKTNNMTDGLRIEMLSSEQTVLKVTNNSLAVATYAARLDFTEPIGLLKTDIIASNGVIHEVEALLFPAWSYLNLMELLSQLNDRFSIFIGLLKTSGLNLLLTTAQNVSLLAFTNQAFLALSQDVRATLTDPENSDQLGEVLRYHIVPGVINFEALPQGKSSFVTAQGEAIEVNREDTASGAIDLSFNGAESDLFFLTRWNIMYQLDEVLFPSSFNPSETFGPSSSLQKAFPTLAPSKKFLELSLTPSQASVDDSVDDILSKQPALSSFNSLLGAAGLATALRNIDEGPFTVYCPNNVAFAEVDNAYAADLQTDQYSLHLTSFMLNHLQEKKLDASQLTDGLILEMESGLTATVVKNGNATRLYTTSVELNYTRPIDLIVVDIPSSNGLVHVLNSVLFPNWYFFNPLQAMETLPKTFGTFSRLIALADLPEAISRLAANTILGPNEEAFAKLPTKTLDYLMEPGNRNILRSLLLHHVIDEMIPFTSLSVGEFEATTLLGDTLLVSVTENESGELLLRFNTAVGVGQAFYLSKNDLIYELGEVLIPPSLSQVIPHDNDAVALGGELVRGAA